MILSLNIVGHLQPAHRERTCSVSISSLLEEEVVQEMKRQAKLTLWLHCRSTEI